MLKFKYYYPALFLFFCRFTFNQVTSPWVSSKYLLFRFYCLWARKLPLFLLTSNYCTNVIILSGLFFFCNIYYLVPIIWLSKTVQLFSFHGNSLYFFQLSSWVLFYFFLSREFFWSQLFITVLYSSFNIKNTLLYCYLCCHLRVSSSGSFTVFLFSIQSLIFMSNFSRY